MDRTTSLPGSMLLDTNVWIDYFLDDRAGFDDARTLLKTAGKAGVQILHAVSTMKDIFFLIEMDFKREARRRAGGKLRESDAAMARAFAWASIEDMGRVSTAVGCDQSDVWLAQKQRRLHNDFEDDLVTAAAVRSEASIVVTNDQELLRHCPVAALSTQDGIKVLTA